MLGWFVAVALAGPIPEDTRRLVLVIAPDEDASTATMTRWERAEDAWVPVGVAVSARLGDQGVAWGRGLHPPQAGLQKREGDGRSPQGVFEFGAAYGYAARPPDGSSWPYHQVGARDLWIEDPTLPGYNTHVVVPPGHDLEPWQVRNRMRQGDAAHALKVFVAHNAAPDVSVGAGSGIFVHVWRQDGRVPTTGCTSIPRRDVDALVSWLEPAGHPVLVQLTAAEHARWADPWGLPTP
jgi:L,D-peptidoglycan transpeptidase YkuD (ErfK/YbiS/YcfS/YnhG family)